MRLLIALCVTATLVCSVRGHGRLIDPVARSSAWRYGFANAVRNYEDNALRCGGVPQLPGPTKRCGVCGDPVRGTKDNEAGGKYANGIIVKTYREGEIIEVTAQITANHRGWMEFRICPNNDVKKAVTHDCLDRNLLKLADGSGTRYTLTSFQAGDFKVKVILPRGMVCSQCVIQWRYHAGNSWGRHPVTGNSGIGAGAQEEFYGCADVAIVPRTSSGQIFTNRPTVRPPLTQRPVTQQPIPQRPATTKRRTNRPPATQPPAMGGLSATCRGIGIWANDLVMDAWCSKNCPIGNCPQSACDCSGGNPQPPTTTTTTTTTRPTTTRTTARPTTTTTTTTPKPAVNTGGCRGIGIWANDPQMDAWCSSNCPIGNCPQSACDCSGGNPQPPTTTTKRPTTTTTTTTKRPTTTTTKRPTTSTTKRTTSTTSLVTPRGPPIGLYQCKAINHWAGMSYFDRWCSDTCARGNCPPDACLCTISGTTPSPTPPPATQSTLICKAISVWKDIDVFDKWCMDECNKGNCQSNACTCTNAHMVPISTTTTTTTKRQTTPTPTKTPTTTPTSKPCYSNGVVGGNYWNTWCADNCRRGYCATEYCFC